MISEGSPIVSENSEYSAKPNELETQSADWCTHEHVSAQVQLEAEKLVQLVGNAELAKHAISVVEQKQQSLPSDSKASKLLALNRHTSALKVSTFLTALSEFETLLATPIVAGELTEWVSNASRACEIVKNILCDDMQSIHAELYSSILRDNIVLSSQVEKLRATDFQISQVDCNEVISRLSQLLNLARTAQQDEARLALVTADVVTRAMEFVVSARSQETAIAVWLNEAVNRDLGSGD